MTLTEYLALSKGAATTIALWILFAHAHDAFQISPILAITSPEMRCGKTTLLELISALVPRPLTSSSITVATVFRAVDQFQPTLLIDEADTFLKDRDEIRGILNSGHRRTMAAVLRTAGDEYEVRSFSTWSPKTIALIGKLPTTLADRSIEVRMQRRTEGEHIQRLRLDRLSDLEPLRRRIWTWAQKNQEQLQAADPSLPEALHDRAMDNWRPLVSIADLSGGVWPKRARRAALLLSGQNSDDDESLGALLLGDIHELFKSAGDTDRLASTQITTGLGRREDRPWPEFRKGSPITVRQVARLLRPFSVKPKPLWIDGKTQQGYEFGDLAEVFGRYLPGSHPQGTQESNNDATNSGFSIPKADPHLGDRKSGERPVNTRGLGTLGMGIPPWQGITRKRPLWASLTISPPKPRNPRQGHLRLWTFRPEDGGSRKQRITHETASGWGWICDPRHHAARRNSSRRALCRVTIARAFSGTPRPRPPPGRPPRTSQRRPA